MNNGKGISVHVYTLIDLSIFTILAVVFEVLSVKVFRMTQNEFIISISYAIALIAMMRWGWKSIYIVPLISVIYVALNGGTLEAYVSRGVGSFAIAFNLLWFIKGKEFVSNSWLFTLLYALTAYILISLGQSVVGVFFGKNFINLLIGFLATNALSGAIGIIVLLIARKQKVIFMDQMQYLRELKKKEESEERYDE